MGGEPLATVGIGLTVLIGTVLYLMIRQMQPDVDLVPVLEERLNENRAKTVAEENRVLARIDRLDKDWRALFASVEKYIVLIEQRIARLEDRVDELQAKRERVDITRG